MGDLLFFIINLLSGLSERKRTAAPPSMAQRPLPPRMPAPQPPALPQSAPVGRVAPPMRPVAGKRAAPRPPQRPAVAPPAAAKPVPPPAVVINALSAPRSSAPPMTVTAAAIRRWAVPTRLQQQFILTEIFQPPLGIREQNNI